MRDAAQIDPQAAWDAAKPVRRFNLIPFDKIPLATGRNYVIKDLIPREGLVVVWGPPKSGKSFWIFDALMHVAMGWEYRGRKVTQGPVVYVSCEGERGLGARAAAFREAKLSEEAAVPDFHLVTTRLDLIGEHQELIGDIAKTLGEQRSVAICIDTLNRSIRGSESNDRDMGDYVRAADAIREAFGCAVIIVHHCGLEGTRPRGHTSLTGACDAQIAVKRDTAGNVICIVEFMKDGAEGDELCSMLEVVDVDVDQDGDAITSCVIQPTDAPVVRTKAKPVLRGKAGEALRQLHNYLALGNGHSAPATDLIPNGAQVAPLDGWKEHLFVTNVLKRTDANPRTDYQRIETRLRDGGLIGMAEVNGTMCVWREVVPESRTVVLGGIRPL